MNRSVGGLDAPTNVGHRRGAGCAADIARAEINVIDIQSAGGKHVVDSIVVVAAVGQVLVDVLAVSAGLNDSDDRPAVGSDPSPDILERHRYRSADADSG